MRYGIVAAVVGFLFLAAGIVCPSAFSQDFPYAVPQAPEFDTRGKYVKPRVKKKRSHHKAPRAGTGNSAVRRKPQPIVRQRGPVQARAPRRVAGPATIANMPSGAQTSAQPRPNCTQYPTIIARSKTQAEMQMNARLYLTCLLKNGWNMQAAKNQVISTIKGVFSPQAKRGW
jgi:hypothetical protein